jgi:hypothetical protein
MSVSSWVHSKKIKVRPELILEFFGSVEFIVSEFEIISTGYNEGESACLPPDHSCAV